MITDAKGSKLASVHVNTNKLTVFETIYGDIMKIYNVVGLSILGPICPNSTIGKFPVNWEIEIISPEHDYEMCDDKMVQICIMLSTQFKDNGKPIIQIAKVQRQGDTISFLVHLGPAHEANAFFSNIKREASILLTTNACFP